MCWLLTVLMMHTLQDGVDVLLSPVYHIMILFYCRDEYAPCTPVLL